MKHSPGRFFCGPRDRQTDPVTAGRAPRRAQTGPAHGTTGAGANGKQPLRERKERSAKRSEDFQMSNNRLKNRLKKILMMSSVSAAIHGVGALIAIPAISAVF